ncbi:MAG: tyrosine-type recombinase/integrase [Bacteroidia bacterium]|nr:tyrosine-type recombinase/integrase [Bacteroidia bacterium]
MKKKIILKRIFHRNGWRYAIIFDYDKNLTELVRTVNNVTWSQTNKCWYAGDDEETLKQILAVFRESADIDISAIVSGESQKPPAEPEALNTEMIEDIGIPSSASEAKSSTIKKTISQSNKQGYSPVLFTISEPDGRLVIKFTGKYDKEWIRELNEFGRPYYDANRNEWLLRWSQIAVDSLSDYFSLRGVEVIVKKREVSGVLKELRDEQSCEVRNRILGEEAIKSVDMVRRYLEEKRYSKRTCRSYLDYLELFFKYFHDKDPLDIKEEDISAFIDDHVIRLGYSASYQNLIISSIKIYLSLCGLRRFNPDSVERPRRSRALPKVFSKEEVMKIFSVTRNSKHKLILWLTYSCGLRRSEVTNIKLNDLDTDRGILHIREGKGNADRMVPVPQKVWEKIGVYIKGYNPEVYLFEGQSGGKYSVESVYSVFKQSLRRAGIKKDVGVHCLRHSYATHLHESGLDIRYIQELLGHKSTRTTEIYTHVSRRNLFAIRSPIEDMEIE